MGKYRWVVCSIQDTYMSFVPCLLTSVKTVVQILKARTRSSFHLLSSLCVGRVGQFLKFFEGVYPASLLKDDWLQFSSLRLQRNQRNTEKALSTTVGGKRARVMKDCRALVFFYFFIFSQTPSRSIF